MASLIGLWSLFAFSLAVYLLFKQPVVKIPFTKKYLHVDYSLAPIIGVLLLLPTSLLTVDRIWEAVIGTGNVRPYTVIILILSLSYLCYSLDQTGFFDYASLKLLGGISSRKKLFFLLAFWIFLLTLFTNNDIVILTLTFLTCEFARRTSIDPKPLLFTEFFTVNTGGMILYIGNPTNIILSDAAGVNFVEYAKWMLLPSLLLTAIGICWLWVLFGRKIGKFRPPKLDPSLALQDKVGSIIGMVSLASSILMMALGFSPWKVALIFALFVFAADLVRKPSEVWKICRKVPWKLSYFLLGFFVLVKGLEHAGILRHLPSLLKLVEKGPLGVGGLILISSLTAAIMNNHPMSILFAGSFENASRLSVFACVVGSNLGANISLVGALAGLLWSHILLTKGVEVTFSEFSKCGMLYTLPLALLMGFLLWFFPVL